MEPFISYIERTPRCNAVELRRENVAQVSQFLRGCGYYTTLIDGKEFTLTVMLPSTEVLFTADVDEGDAIIHSDSSVHMVKGVDFRRMWKKEN